MTTTAQADMAQVRSMWSTSLIPWCIDVRLQLNTKLDELKRLIKSDYETNKAVSLFQYFDKIYTSCYGTPSCQTLIETLVQEKYAGKSCMLLSCPSTVHTVQELCYPILERIHGDVFKTQERWHVTYYLLHSLWNHTDKTQAMCSVCARTKLLAIISLCFLLLQAVVDAKIVPMLILNLKQETYLKHFSTNEVRRRSDFDETDHTLIFYL